MKTRGRVAIVSVVTAAVMLIGGPAFAHVCTNTAKPQDAASAGVVQFEATTGESVLIEGELTPNGNLKGGFITFIVTFEGAEVAVVDIFAHNTLPLPARSSGPGDDACDGVGIDDAEACLLELLGPSA